MGVHDDAERSMIWLAPSRKGSVWAASNRERVERLEREGRMRPASARSDDLRKPDIP